MDIGQSDKLANVCYDIRGPVLKEAQRLEQEGERVLKLHIGNPATFGFAAPEELVREVVENLPRAHGYSDSKGLLAARQAVAAYHTGRGVAGVGAEDTYLGNGVSELIVMALQALLNDGDEVLVPAPDYPLWTAAVSLAGGRARHYRCVESSGWQPDVDHLASLVTRRTRAIVVINPNNPTGAVYPPDVLESIAELARRHHLVLMSDEIYDRIVYDGVTHTSTAALAPDVLCLTFSGLSKSYRVAGFRAGWMVLSGPRRHAAGYVEGLDVLANMRLCANVPGQYAVRAALGDATGELDLVLPGGRLLEQRDVAWRMLTEIPGVSCTRPAGALYLFPRLDPEVYPIRDDQAFVLDLLRAERILVVQGTGFNWARPDHFRIVTLPPVQELAEAVARIGDFLSSYTP